MNLKLEAARHALAFVRSGMVLGLGTGSTAGFFIDLLGRQLAAGALCDIVAVPTSQDTADRARAAGVPLTTLDDHGSLDLAVDGADEVDPALNLLKGLGRALTREKVVAAHARRLVILVDESKCVDRLGCLHPLPVEILPFGAGAHVRWLGGLGCEAWLWREADGTPVVTDNGNYLALCRFAGGIADAPGLARALADRPGIVEHGLFLGFAPAVVVAGGGGVRVVEGAL